jgi:hypothetical protein
MELFSQLESQYGLPSGLLDSVWSAESGRGQSMRSPKGAEGHFQFMPGTARQYGVADPGDLLQSATGAARMYADLLKQYGGDLPRALAGYNWGQGNMARKGFEAAPAETRNYIAKVTNAMGQPQARAQQDAPSDDWSTLNAQFAPTQARQADQPDPWADLSAQFKQQPAAPKQAQQAQAQPAGAMQAATPAQPQGEKLGLVARAGMLVPGFGALINAINPATAENKMLKGAASGFADAGNTIINSGTNAGADALSSINDQNGLIDPRFKRPGGLSSLVTGQQPLSPMEQANADRSAGLAQFNKDNASIPFTVGRIGGNIAATAPVGGALGATVKGMGSLPLLGRFAPALTAAGDAIGSGGMTTGLAPTSIAGQAGNLALRMTGGAANGAATSALIDPASAKAGAVIGAALPPVIAGIGKVSSLAAAGIRSLTTPDEVRAAKAILDAGGLTSPQEIAAVRAAVGQMGPNIIAEGTTVPQILQNPGISQLQRTLQNAGGSAIAEKEAGQNASRLATLNRVSPVTGTVQQSAENFGNALAPQVIAADAAARQRVGAAFDAVDPQGQARLLLPLDQMQAARERFLGRATFGNGGRADQALATAQRIGTEAAPAQAAAGPAFTSGGVPLSAADRQAVAAALGGAQPAGAAAATRPAAIPFREVQDLRSSISEAAQQARLAGSNREAAALDSMLGSIDESVRRAAQGGATAVENFTPEMAHAWQVARDLHAERMANFRAGPQASIFRQGGDGLPQAQGAELAGKFFSPRMSQSSDIASFNRIATPETQAALKNYAITDAANQTDRLGNLTNAKFNNWLDGRSGAVNGLMNEGERAQLRGVASDLFRADQAATLNMAKGSPTVQNALSLGALDNKVVKAILNRTPLIGRFTGPMLEALQNTARAGKVAQIGGLLADPVAFDSALAQYLSQSSRAPIGILDPAWLGLVRSAPALQAGSGRQ